jgi:uncharacterized membrane protein
MSTIKNIRAKLYKFNQMFNTIDRWLSNWNPPLKRLHYLVISTLLVGIFFRFANIDRQLYWCDEVYTSLRVSGYLQPEMDRQLRDGRLINISDLHKYQYPNLDKTALNTINGLIAEESQLSPLYFVMVRWWVELFGNSIAITRSLSAFISLLTFPCIYWLCRELFESSSVGWIAMSIVAVSPVHLIYAQEARPYSLSIVTTLLSGAALLRAMRLKTKMSWGIYGATLTLGLYTQLFFGFVIIAQSLYLIFSEKWRLTKNLVAYIMMVCLGSLTFVPWAWIFITHPTPGNLMWVNTKQTLLEIAIRWVGIISRAVIDVGIAPKDPLPLKLTILPIISIVFALIVYAVYFLWRHTPTRVWLFVISLIASICVPLAILDFGLGKRYGTTRYILPSTLGIQLALAYLLNKKIAFIDRHQWQQKIWAGIYCGLITLGIGSCYIHSQSQIWWNKLPEVYQEYPKMAMIINRAARPLVITDTDVTNVQVLGHLLDRKTKFQIVDSQQAIEINPIFTEVFLFTPSEALKSKVQRGYNSQVKVVNNSLWKVTQATQPNLFN